MSDINDVLNQAFSARPTNHVSRPSMADIHGRVRRRRRKRAVLTASAVVVSSLGVVGVLAQRESSARNLTPAAASPKLDPPGATCGTDGEPALDTPTTSQPQSPTEQPLLDTLGAPSPITVSATTGVSTPTAASGMESIDGSPFAETPPPICTDDADSANTPNPSVQTTTPSTTTPPQGAEGVELMVQLCTGVVDGKFDGQSVKSILSRHQAEALIEYLSEIDSSGPAGPPHWCGILLTSDTIDAILAYLRAL